MQPATKEKWEKLKEGTNKVLQVSSNLATTYLTPVLEKGK